jgi:hypothetical protein
VNVDDIEFNIPHDIWNFSVCILRMNFDFIILLISINILS